MDKGVAESLRDYTRAVGGGLVIGLPLLYTMEVWFEGFILPWWKLLLLVAITLVIVLGYNSIAGFRRERTNWELAVDSVTTVGLGIVIAFVVLVVLGRIDAATSLRDAAGKVALESIPIAIGSSVAATQLGGSGGKGGGGNGGDGQSSRAIGPFHRLLVGAGGALLFALNIAPTEEPVMLGIDAAPWLLLLVMGGTLLLTMALVFYADFGGRRSARGDSLLDHPISETITGYAVSLAICLFMLWSFGRTDETSVQAIAGMTVMLAVIAAVGAAIGRLLISGGNEAGGSGS